MLTTQLLYSTPWHQAARSPCLQQHHFGESRGYRKLDSGPTSHTLSRSRHPRDGLSLKRTTSSSDKLLLSSNLPVMWKENPCHAFLLKGVLIGHFTMCTSSFKRTQTHARLIKGALQKHRLHVNRMFSVYCFFQSQQRQIPHIIMRSQPSLNEKQTRKQRRQSGNMAEHSTVSEPQR